MGMVKDVPEGEEGCLLGLAFVLSGILDSLDRDAAQTLIERYGGRITSAVSGKTDYLLMGSDPGESKKRKAEALHTKIVDEDGLFELIRTRKGKSLSAEQAVKAKAAAAKTNKAASAAQQSAQGVTASIDTATSKGQEQLRVHGKVAERAEDMLWVDKHRPLKLTEIIGNGGLVKRLGDFLTSWDAVHLHAGKPDKDSPKAVLISGAPGLGKSTAASLVAREKGFHVVEFNASDVRNKSALEGVVGQLVANHGLDEYYSESAASSSSSSSSSKKGPAGKKTVVIMDEVDGIAGNEDRGGLQQLVQLIKRSRIPIICIANDTSTPKMKTLKSHTLHLTWRRPTTDQIVPRLTAIATAEGLAVDLNAMRKLIESTQADIRQCINFLQMYGKTHKKLTFDTVVQSNEAGGGKDFDVGVFEVVPSFFRDPGRKPHWIDARSDLYFVDSGLVPLFVQELYVKGKARLVSGGQRRQNVSAEKATRLLECDAMDVVSQAADFIGGADTMNAVIYQEQDYTFMPVHAVLSSVAPGYLMSAGGVQGGMSFPTWLGQNSSRMKRQRLIRDMKMAMSLTAPASFTDYVTNYLPALRIELIEPFKQQSTDDAVTAVCDTLDQLGLVREDWDTLVEVTDDLVPPKEKVGLEGQVKRRFTTEWKRGEHKVKVRRGEIKAEKGGAGGAKVGSDELEDEDGPMAADEEVVDEEGEEGKEADDIKKDPMIVEAKEGSVSKGRGGSKGGGRGGAGRAGRGRGRDGAGAGGKSGKAAAGRGGRGKRGRGGSAKKKGGKEERSEDEDDDDDMADFIVDDDDE